MADTKVSDLTASADATASDLLYLVDEATTSKKITFANFEGSIDHTNILNIGTNTHAEIDTHLASSALHFTQGAISITASQVSDFDTEVSNNTTVASNYASCALIEPHIADSSDPHGASLTQTNMNVGSMAITTDLTASLAQVVRNILIGTDSTPPTASNYTQGTIYVQYTP